MFATLAIKFAMLATFAMDHPGRRLNMSGRPIDSDILFRPDTTELVRSSAPKKYHLRPSTPYNLKGHGSRDKNVRSFFVSKY